MRWSHLVGTAAGGRTGPAESESAHGAIYLSIPVYFVIYDSG